MFVQLAFEYREQNIHARRCLRTARSTSNKRTFLLRRLAKLHLYHGLRVLYVPVHLSSVMVNIDSKLESCRNYKFIGDIIQETSNWDSITGSNLECNYRCK